jgi:hypothetical protein
MQHNSLQSIGLLLQACDILQQGRFFYANLIAGE